MSVNKTSKVMTKGLLFSVIIVLLMISGCTNSGIADEQEDKENGNSQVEYEKTDEQIRQLKQLNRTAELFYSHVKEQKMEKARIEMNVLSQLITEISFQGMTTVEGVQAVSSVILEAKSSITELEFQSDRALLSAAKVRLVIDALADPKRPMWQQYRDVVNKDLQMVIAADEKKQLDQLKTGLEQLQRRYQIIKPAVVVQQRTVVIEKMDSLFMYMNELLKKDHAIDRISEQMQVPMDELANSINELFQLNSEETQAPMMNERQPILWSMYIGSVIVIALGYVGWRRYQYEQNVPATVTPKKERMH